MIIIEWLIWWVDSLFAACRGQWYIRNAIIRFCFVAGADTGILKVGGGPT